ncbi:MAG: preprotein translocase subunit SecG [Verrucomicrobia bacterium]|jgi:preprotein translocase subunit SecG|nr:preprotein translocase subunit SecG [Verrucomicrobiota bacterium]MBT7064763.1 preprotein translocase subunit SecG [Verrucomicrobiota bacterium]MBT7700970.1 preprotein translocase subunit SecG [Verrucomicrobiota bacterium]
MATFVRYVLILIEVLCSLLLIGVILVQRTKSQGLGMALGGQMGEALFGARMGNVMTKVTVILGIVFLVNTTLLAYIGASSRTVSVTDGVAPPPAVPTAPATPMGGVPPLAPPMDMPVDAVPAVDTTVAIPAPVVIDEAGATAPAVPVTAVEVPAAPPAPLAPPPPPAPVVVP